jgi:hypothetical protein
VNGTDTMSRVHKTATDLFFFARKPDRLTEKCIFLGSVGGGGGLNRIMGKFVGCGGGGGGPPPQTLIMGMFMAR